MGNKSNTLVVVIISVFVLLVVSAGVFVLLNSNEESESEDNSTQASDSSEIAETERTEPTDTNQVETAEAGAGEERTTAGMGDEAGIYTEYSPELVSSEAYSNRIIFFKADWCPTCSVLDRDIEENLADIPQGTIILEADYDEEIELRKEYDVSVQHTLVLVDQDGEELEQWAGSFNLEDVLDQAGIS